MKFDLVAVAEARVRHYSKLYPADMIDLVADLDGRYAESSGACRSDGQRVETAKGIAWHYSVASLIVDMPVRRFEVFERNIGRTVQRRVARRRALSLSRILSDSPRWAHTGFARRSGQCWTCRGSC